MTSDFAPEIAKYPNLQNSAKWYASLLSRSVSDAACFNYVHMLVAGSDTVLIQCDVEEVYTLLSVVQYINLCNNILSM